jgi:hypothetical protein
MLDVLRICESIPGWMYPAELQWLYEQAQSRRYIVEIGVYQGRSTLALAAGTPGHVIGIDTWEGGPAEREVWHPEFATAEGRDAVYLAAWQNLRDRPVTLLRVDAARAWTVLKAGIEMLFHDGAHDEDSLRRDILNYSPLMARGGLWCGHDYNHSWPGVMRAADDIFGGRVQRGPGSIWFVEEL